MKQKTAFILCAAMFLSLAACGKKTATPSTLPGDNPPMAEDILD